MNAKRPIENRAVLIASLALYLVSLGLPALEFNSHAPVRGLTALMWGWWGVVTLDFPWFANPAFFLALFLAFLGVRLLSLILSGAALCLGSLSMFVHAWYFNEAAGTPVERLGPAFYLWMASFLVLFFGVCVRGVPKPKNCVQPNSP